MWKWWVLKNQIGVCCRWGCWSDTHLQKLRTVLPTPLLPNARTHSSVLGRGEFCSSPAVVHPWASWSLSDARCCPTSGLWYLHPATCSHLQVSNRSHRTVRASLRHPSGLKPWGYGRQLTENGISPVLQAQYQDGDTQTCPWCQCMQEHADPAEELCKSPDAPRYPMPVQKTVAYEFCRTKEKPMRT